jgi:hypothetical protein
MTYVWPNSVGLNEQLRECILSHAAQDRGVQATNIGGWHSANGDLMHTHPGMTWSGVYYVDTGESPGQNDSGILKFMDPSPGCAASFLPFLARHFADKASRRTNASLPELCSPLGAATSGKQAAHLNCVQLPERALSLILGAAVLYVLNCAGFRNITLHWLHAKHSVS